MTATAQQATGTSGVGDRLRQGRQHADLTVSDLAERTRIQPHIIRDIERDDFSSCRGSFYARGHVKSLAAALDLDPAPLLAELDRTQGSAPPVVTGTPVPALDSPPAPQRGPRWVSMMVAAAGVVVLLVILSAILGVVRGGHSSPPAPVRAAASAAPSQAPSAPASAAPAAPVSVALRLAAVGRPTWVSVTSTAGAPLFVGLLHTGEPRTFSATGSVSVRYGSPSSVEVTRNGTALGHPHCTGRSVCTLTYAPTGAPTQAG